MSEPKFSSRILRRFVEIVALELGADQFATMIALAKLPAQWTNTETLVKLDAGESAKAYALLQAAMRTYFGRGARGVLLRVGQRLWSSILEDASLGNRGQAAMIKVLPANARRKATLELLARFLGGQPGDITVHTLDLDLLFVDHTSPAAEGCHESAPICFVTQGLIRESLFWATQQGQDVEETACKARGDHNCEFKITAEK